MHHIVDQDVVDNENVIATEAASRRNNRDEPYKPNNLANTPKFTVNEAPVDCIKPAQKGRPQGIGIDFEMLEEKYSKQNQDDVKRRNSLSVQDNQKIRPRSKSLEKSLSDRSHKKHFKHIRKIKENIKG